MHSLSKKRAAKVTQKQRKRRKEAGLWLRELRERRGLSQRELAEAVGVEVYTVISQLEHGYGVIPPDRYAIWAEALGIEPDEFVRQLTLLPQPHDTP